MKDGYDFSNKHSKFQDHTNKKYFQTGYLIRVMALLLICLYTSYFRFKTKGDIYWQIVESTYDNISDE